MEWREERWGLPDEPRGSNTARVADERLGTVPAVGLLLLVALNLAIIAQLAWRDEVLATVLVVLAAAVAILDLAVALLLVRTWWPGRDAGAVMRRVE